MSGATILALREEFKEVVLKPLKKFDYFLADSRIEHVTLFDHLVLTGGIATALTRELLDRGRRPEDFCGLGLSKEELLKLADLCGCAHDIGKGHRGRMDYMRHVPRGVESVSEWLKGRVDDRLRQVICGTVQRHHLRHQPESLLEKVVCLADKYASAGDRPELARGTTSEELHSSARGTLALEEELFDAEKPLSLLMADCDRIKAFVFETDGLPEIRGASQMLKEAENKLEDAFEHHLSRNCIIYCKGGSLLALVPAGRSAQWRRRVEEEFVRTTGLATMTAATLDSLGYLDLGRGLEPYDDESASRLPEGGPIARWLVGAHRSRAGGRAGRKNFGELVAALVAKLHASKLARAEVPFVCALPVHARCQSCGRRPSSYRDEVTGRRLCRWCGCKRKHGRDEKAGFRERIKEWFRENDRAPKVSLTRDLKDVADRGGRIALLYCDGNGFGDLLQRARAPADYRSLSEAIESAVWDSLMKTLKGVIGWKPPPFEIILCGGDDLALFLRPDLAWKIACEFAREFQKDDRTAKLSEALQSPELSVSMGLCYADLKYPASFIFNMAERLLARAKQKARRAQPKSALCHLWLRGSAVLGDADDPIRGIYERRGFSLTARPYTLDEAVALAKAAAEVNRVPSSQRKAIAEALERGPAFSANFVGYQRARNRGVDNALRAALDKLSFLHGRADALWTASSPPKTALLDVLELCELGVK